MDEETQQDIIPEEKLKQLNAERKNLRAYIHNDRKARLVVAAEMRDGREAKIEKIQVKLKEIQSVIYQYNKLGKVAKNEFDVLGIVQKALNAEEGAVHATDSEN